MPNTLTRPEYPLTQLLQQEVVLAEQMLEALQAESLALGTHSAEQLEAATQHKLEAMQAMEKAGKQREQLLAAWGKHTPQADPAALLQHQTLKPHWEKLMSLAEQCQQLNRVNANVVTRSYQQSCHALGILQGLTGTEKTRSAETYDHYGQTAHAQRSRAITRA